MPERSFFVPLNPGDVIRVRLMIEQGTIVDFVLQYETYIAGRWYPVIRYDGSHGEAHRDTLDQHGHTIAKDWLGPMTYTAAVAYASDDLRSNWRTYRDRFMERFR